MKNNFSFDNIGTKTFDGFPQILCTVDSKWRIVSTNKLWQSFTGKKEKEVVGKSFLDLLHQSDRIKLKRANGNNIHCRILSDKKSPRWISCQSMNLSQSDLTLLIMQDITETKIKEEKLEQVEKDYRHLFDSTNEAIFIHHAKTGKILEVNETMLKMYGFTRKEFDRLGFADVTASDDEYNAEKAMKYIKHAIEIGPIVFPWLAKKKDGTLFWVEVSLSKTAVASMDSVIAVVRDLTKRHEVEKTIEDNALFYKTLFDTAHEAIFIMENDKFIDCNPKTLKMFGCSRKQIIGEPPYKFSPLFQSDGRDSKEKALEKINAVLAGKSQQFEWRHCRYNKTEFDAEVSLNLLQLSNRTLIQAIVRDISKRKKAELDLTNRINFENLVMIISNRFINISVDSIGVNIKKALNEICQFVDIESGYLFLFNSDKTAIDPSYLWFVSQQKSRKKIFANASINQMKWWHKKIMANSIIELSPDDVPKTAVSEKEMITNLKLQSLLHIPMLFEEKVIGIFGLDTKKSQRKWQDFELANLQRLGQIFTSAIIRKISEDSLRLSEANFKSIVQHMSDIVWILDEKMIIKYETPSSSRVMGYDANYFVGKSGFDFIHRNDLRNVLEDLKGVVDQTNLNIPSEFRAKHAKGYWVHLQAVGINLLDDPVVRGVVITARDISRRLRYEKSLIESEKKYRNIFENFYDIYFEADIEGKIHVISPSVTRLTGIETKDLINRDVSMFFTAENDWNELIKELDSDTGIGEFNVTFIDKSGKFRSGILNVKMDLDSDGKGNKISGVIRDVTESKKLEKQLRQSQKMEAVGRLAGGIAHDFNNILTAILGNSDLALYAMDSKDPAKEMLEDIKEAANRAANLTRQLLTFSRSKVMEKQFIDLNVLFRELNKMLQRLVPENIKLKLKLNSLLPVIEGDKSQLEQAFINLVINSVDALQNGGKIFIETSDVTVHESLQGKGKTILPGSYLLVTVGDNGHGIQKETLEHIFEPFFTTKDIGKGTGLGLSMVYGIVNQHNGIIQVESSTDKGTRIYIYFPQIDKNPDAIEKKVIKKSHPQSNETILVIEDDIHVMDFVSKSLKSHGYTVLTATSPKEALKIAKKKTAIISLAISDLIMPEMNGRELIGHLKLIIPELKVVFMSGYADDILNDKEEQSEFSFIPKPFTIEELVKCVKENLPVKD